MDSTASELKLYIVIPVLLASIWKLSAEHVMLLDMQSRRIKVQQGSVLKHIVVDITDDSRQEKKLAYLDSSR